MRKIAILTKKMLILSIATTLTTQAGSLLLDKDKSMGGWRGFGTGYADGTGDMDSKEITLDVIWSNASWGVGAMHELKNPINGRDLKSIRLEVRTMEGSDTRVFAGLSTKDGAHLAQNARFAEKISDSWETLEFPISEMRVELPEKDSRPFDMKKDWNKIQIVKLIFTKPGTLDIAQDIIRVRNPQLVYKDSAVGN